MPQKAYALEKGGEKKIELSWKIFWKDFIIKYNGQVVGTMSGQKELTAGREFSLSDGSTLKVQLVRKLFAVELQVLRNGQPLLGSSSDPYQKIKVAAIIIFFIGGFNIIFGLLGIVLSSSILMQLGAGYEMLVIGVIFLILGFFVRRRSAIALGMAIGLLVVDAVLTLMSAAHVGRTPASGLVVRMLLVIILFQGFGAIRALKANQ